MMDRIAILQQKIQRLRELDPKFTIFGARSHQYRFNPCLTEAEIQAFEQKHRIELPEDYRDFLLHVGNGGACDGIRMYPLKADWQDPAVDTWYESYLATPFPHTSEWTDVPLIWQETGDKYVVDRLMTGSLLLAFQGCTINLRLVVNGAEKGNVWMEDLGADIGIVPLHPEGDPTARLDFFTWYDEWLDRSIDEIQQPAAPVPNRLVPDVPAIVPVPAEKPATGLQRFLSVFGWRNR